MPARTKQVEMEQVELEQVESEQAAGDRIAAARENLRRAEEGLYEAEREAMQMPRRGPSGYDLATAQAVEEGRAFRAVDQRTGLEVAESNATRDQRAQQIRQLEAAAHDSARRLIEEVRGTVAESGDAKAFGSSAAAVDMRKVEKLTRAELHRISADVDDERAALAEKALRILDGAKVPDLREPASRAVATGWGF